MDIIINVVEEIVKEKHISYFVKRDGSQISLHQIVEAIYIHPDSDNQSTISRIETRDVFKCKTHEFKAAPLLLLDNALKNIELLKKGELL